MEHEINYSLHSITELENSLHRTFDSVYSTLGWIGPATESVPF